MSWRPINTAPRDGTFVEVMADDEPRSIYVMRWNPAGYNGLVQPEPTGIWESEGNNFTWSESRGFGPTHWRRLGSGLN
jgi:hypothetical protein